MCRTNDRPTDRPNEPDDRNVTAEGQQKNDEKKKPATTLNVIEGTHFSFGAIRKNACEFIANVRRYTQIYVALTNFSTEFAQATNIKRSVCAVSRK